MNRRDLDESSHQTDGSGDASIDREERLAQILADYADRVNAGEPVEVEDVLEANPDLAADLAVALEGLAALRPETSDDTNGPLGVLGDYTLRRQIGRGGMGVVYDAWQNSVDRQVALKVLPQGVAADAKTATRFIREAQIAAKLNHPQIVGVYGSGVEAHTPYYSMEYVEGETLSRILGKTKNADVDAATPFGKKDDGRYFMNIAEAFAAVADGLQHAHSRGVIHRDIKPSNLILDRETDRGGGAIGRLRILDFGLARLEGQESLTISGDIVGTPLYMSPEQARRKTITVDHRTDVYSLGATMYEMLAGRPPFSGKDHADTLSQIIERDPVEPRKLNPRVPSELATIVLKCLRKDPGDRYGTAEALAQDLRRFVRSDPIEARPQTRATKIARWLKSHRRSLIPAVAAFLVTIALFWLLLLQQRAAYSRADAEYGLIVREAAMLVLRSRLSTNAASGREVAGALSVEPAAALLPEDFRPDKQNENDLRGISEELKRMNRELPERPEAYYFLLLSHTLLGQSEEAKALLDELHGPVRRFVPLRLLEKEQSLEPDVGLDEVTQKAATDILADSDGLASWERAWLRAQKELHAGNWSVAVLAYDELLGATEEPFVGASLQARIERGIARLELEDYRGAIDDFYRAWGRWPELQEPALLLGKAYFISGDPEGAEYVFNELHDGMPEPERKRTATWIAAVYHQLDDRVKELEWAAHVDGSLRSRLRCWPLLWDGRYEEAVGCFREALRRYPDDLNLLGGLGYSLAFLTEGRRGAQRDKQVAELLGIAEKRADLLLSRPEKERDKLLEAGACYILTLALRRQEDYEAALEAVDRFRQDGEHPQLVDIAYAGVLNDMKEFDTAAEVFESTDDLSVVALSIFGRSLEGQGRYEEAKAQYKKAIAKARRNGSGYSLLAGVLLAEGQTEKAITASQLAIDLFPKNTSAHETLALSYLKQRRLDEALSAAQTGIDAVSDRPGLHVVRGKALASLGRLPEAVESLCKALELYPQAEDAQKTLREILQERLETVTPEDRKSISKTCRERLGRTDTAEIRAILSLLDEAK